jgi:hypothetical protein
MLDMRRALLQMFGQLDGLRHFLKWQTYAYSSRNVLPIHSGKTGIDGLCDVATPYLQIPYQGAMIPACTIQLLGKSGFRVAMPDVHILGYILRGSTAHM